ncbi:M42 family metallopeptidase [Acidaminobacter sp. JC074]|uniref:M42 family metallopeptidase n=1 Tax=Acidaminobacter sp. JC074 TaxID=2530199 RepID=UPI001F10B865|nr:M20/M25/M40 family metallo-hydrolase [Acidaminobacter sp. JC074]MCH4888996.1 M42 family metallopeptidase [Acidaminobacter sp. JC074]
MNKQLEFIKALSDAPGAPGFEDEVIGVIRDYLGDDFDLKEDRMRNLVIYPKNFDEKKPTIMLDGHSDEVAFMVQSIQANGLIRFIALGGWFSQNVGASKVCVRNSDGEYLTGIVASKPPHFMKPAERTKIVEIADMLIDIGASSYEEVVETFKIEPGAPIVPYAKFEYIEKNDTFIGKAFDNRLGCALVVETMLAMKDVDLKVNIVGAISSQEEVGTRGSQLTAKIIQPDAAIVFEGTPADDSHRGHYEAQGVLKKGVQIRHRDNSMVGNPRFISMARNLAKEGNIKFQDAIRQGGGTDAGKIHLMDKAVPTLVFGVPVRYAHTHFGISAYEDYKSTLDLAIKVIEKFDETTLNKL